MKRKLTIPARLSDLSVLRSAVGTFIGTSLDETDKGRVILAIDEAAANIIIHGYNNDESKTIDIDMETDADTLTFIISDTAKEFNPFEFSSPDIDFYHESGQGSGLGVDTYRRIMKVHYERNINGGNRLILVKEKQNEN